MSDLHFEFGKFKLPEMPDDKNTVLVLAGDICPGLGAKVWMEKEKIAERFAHVIYVPGNHEFYNKDMKEILERWVEPHTLGDNIHFLHNGIKIIDGVNFIGTTLWTDFEKRDYFVMQRCRQGINDFRCVTYGGHRFTVDKHVDLHDEAVEFLKKAFAETQGTRVVVTHFLPTFAAVHEKFAGSPINGFYATNLDYLIPEADVWIHGHTHEAHDMMLGDTRVICNPRGYVGYETQEAFDPCKTIEVEAA
jgi:predicted phosphodiesterase